VFLNEFSLFSRFVPFSFGLKLHKKFLEKSACEQALQNINMENAQLWTVVPYF